MHASLCCACGVPLCEVLVIPVFTKMLGLKTCQVWLFHLSVTQLWPSIFAGLFCSLED